MKINNLIANNSAHWLVLFLLILSAWWFLYAMSVSIADPSVPGNVMTHSQAHAGHHGMHQLSAGDAAIFHLFSMWAIMAIAMMAPSMVPTMRAYTDLVSAGAAKNTGFYALLGGYLLIWLVFAVVATVLQIRLDKAGLINTNGQSISLWFNAILLLLTGAYQFSAFKQACLSQCRMPLGFFMAHWRDGTWGAMRMGMRLGVICLFCCWALMLVGFVGGVMSLLWMGVATLFMTLEKLPQVGVYVSRPVGALLILAGCYTVFLALT